MPSRFSPRLVALLALLIAIVSVQFGAASGKHLFPLVGAEGATALRQTFATILLVALFQPWRGGPARKDLGVVALYGALLGIMNLTFYLSIARIPLGVAVAVEFIGPLAVALFGSRRPVDFFWVALAVGGLLLLLPKAGSGPLDPIGVAWALIAGVCWGAYIIVGQKVSDRTHGGKAVALGMLFSLVITLPVGVAHAGVALWSWSVLPWGLAVGLLSSAIPYSLEMVALKEMPAKTFGLMMSLEPAAAALAGLVLLAERLTLMQWLAIGLVVVAAAGSSVTARREVQPVLT